MHTQGMAMLHIRSSRSRRRNLCQKTRQRASQEDKYLYKVSDQSKTTRREDMGPDCPTTISQVEEGLLRKGSKMSSRTSTMGYLN